MAIRKQTVTIEEVMAAVDKIREESTALAISSARSGGVKVLDYRAGSDDYAVLFNESTCHFFTCEDAIRHFNQL